MLKIFAIFIGGGLGASLRWFLSETFCKIAKSFPISTLFVNILGSFILGFLAYYFISRIYINNELKLLLTAGFCGGLTTFSTFAYENYSMLQNGEILKSLSYIFLSITLSLAGVFAGVYLAKQY